jgi:serine/threonine protein phosphatase PrpC
MNPFLTVRWLGRDMPHLDAPFITTCRDVVVGCYGGCPATGANHNEDGSLIRCAVDGSWEFAMLLDAHGSAESAALVLSAVEAKVERMTASLSQPIESAFTSLQSELLALFQSSAFRERCEHVQGETACLFCARKERFLWWLSIGDCVVYLFHPELACFGQFALNQRSFYEWVGRANSFALPVPCFASGTRELRRGRNCILMTTDGLIECGTHPFEEPARLYGLFVPDQAAASENVETIVRAALRRVRQERGRDSATLIAWACHVQESGLQSSE